MFRSQNARLRFAVEAGQQIMCRAKLSLYEARGDYQLIVEHMEPAGDGALAKAFEQLKAKLQAEGLFDPDHKQPIPSLPKHIAVITSPTGAAIHDILTVTKRRFPGTAITVLPVAVQGRGAGEEIAAAIHSANQLASDQRYPFDVILCGRGGGSLEDLWAFNEEIVARAIYDSRLPVISAVGHEVDFTIADFVADLRAATPSAAAELLTPNGREMMTSFASYQQLLEKLMQSQLAQRQQQLDRSKTRLRHPGNRLQEHSQRLDELELRLNRAWRNSSKHAALEFDLLRARLQQQIPLHRIASQRDHLAARYHQLEQLIQQRLKNSRQQLQHSMHLLDTVSPLATLTRGYSITTDESGQVITDASGVSCGQTIHTRLADGQLSSTVISNQTTKP